MLKRIYLLGSILILFRRLTRWNFESIIIIFHDLSTDIILIC